MGELYTPGQNGTYAQNYQDSWFLALAEYNHWPGTGATESLDSGTSVISAKQQGGTEQLSHHGFFLDLAPTTASSAATPHCLRRSLAGMGSVWSLNR